MDADPVGSLSFGRIRIRIVKWENGSGTDPGSEINPTKDIRILYLKKKSPFWLIYMNSKLINNKKNHSFSIIFWLKKKSWNFLRFYRSIRIRISPIQISGSGSGSKWYGSTTMKFKYTYIFVNFCITQASLINNKNLVVQRNIGMYSFLLFNIKSTISQLWIERYNNKKKYDFFPAKLE